VLESKCMFSTSKCHQYFSIWLKKKSRRSFESLEITLKEIKKTIPLAIVDDLTA